MHRLIYELESDMLECKGVEQIFEENLKNNSCFYYITKIDNKTIGFISSHIRYLLYHCGKKREVQEFYIDKKYRNKGIGKHLMDEVRKFAESNNVKSIESPPIKTGLKI